MRIRIQTGKGTIPLLTLLGIWSISAMTSLPGLAISPILGDLDQIFPNISDLEIQMLTSLPSLLIIPFVLLSGKLCESKNKILILNIGLFIFVGSGILYFLAKSMTALIVISCLLGVGAGMIIPLSTGLIADFFIGKERTKQLGISSAITNLSLVLATFFAGWLANFNWHYPFIVYILPVFALILTYFLRPKFLAKECHLKDIGTDDNRKTTEISPYVKPNKNYNIPILLGIIAIYFMATYLVLVISFNIPFVVQDLHLSSSYAGTLISIFFLAIMLPGFFINKLIETCKNLIVFYSFIAIVIGLLCIVIFKSFAMLIIGVFIAGFGYGVIQPLIYDKTTLTAKPNKTFFALALVMATNYLAILACPFIIDFFQKIFHDKVDTFPFLANTIIAAACALLAYIFRKGVLFSASTSSDTDNDPEQL